MSSVLNPYPLKGRALFSIHVGLSIIMLPDKLLCSLNKDVFFDFKQDIYIPVTELLSVGFLMFICMECVLRLSNNSDNEIQIPSPPLKKDLAFCIKIFLISLEALSGSISIPAIGAVAPLYPITGFIN